MRIEFVTHDDPLYVLPLFEEFFRVYSGRYTIVQVSGSRIMGSRPRTRLARELLCLYRPLGLARLLGRTARAHLLGRLPRARTAARFYTLEQLCRAWGVPFRRVASPNAPEFVAAMRERRPDVLISIACPHVLKAEVLAVPRRGAVNVHHAPLPQYKGMMPTFWQMYHGEREVGVTVHRMSSQLDEGQPLLQESLPIDPGESLDHLIRRSKRHAAHCLRRGLEALERDDPPTALSASEGSYFTFPTLEEIREFQRRGLRAI
jgi:methionyl-tRNA formyltransferase